MTDSPNKITVERVVVVLEDTQTNNFTQPSPEGLNEPASLNGTIGNQDQPLPQSQDDTIVERVVIALEDTQDTTTLQAYQTINETDQPTP